MVASPPAAIVVTAICDAIFVPLRSRPKLRLWRGCCATLHVLPSHICNSLGKGSNALYTSASRPSSCCSGEAEDSSTDLHKGHAQGHQAMAKAWRRSNTSLTSSLLITIGTIIITVSYLIFSALIRLQLQLQLEYSPELVSWPQLAHHS